MPALHCRDPLATGAGVLAAAAGTILYYRFLAITGYELSIAVSDGGGKAVYWASYGRGGSRYQALAMALILSIVTSYVPLLAREFAKREAAPRARR